MSRPLPGHRVQIDVKFIQPLAGAPKPRKYYQFTAIDDCTRLRVLCIYDRCNQQTAIQFLDYLLERLPFRVEVIQTDNGVEFGASFHWQVLDKGIGHVYIHQALAPSFTSTHSTPNNPRRAMVLRRCFRTRVVNSC
jgi:hypothetical protein